jgi:hypothetical protein
VDKGIRAQFGLDYLIKGATLMNYEVVSATSKDELQKIVNDRLDENYLLGGFSVSEGVFYQVIYKQACGTTRGRR